MPHLFRIDFNETVTVDTVLFSQNDLRADTSGNMVTLFSGLRVSLLEYDIDENGCPDPLIASGVLELNTTEGWGSHVKWCCKIDSRGIVHQSDIL